MKHYYLVFLLSLGGVVFGEEARRITGEVFLVSEEGTALRMAGALVAVVPEQRVKELVDAAALVHSIAARSLAPKVDALCGDAVTLLKDIEVLREEKQRQLALLRDRKQVDAKAFEELNLSIERKEGLVLPYKKTAAEAVAAANMGVASLWFSALLTVGDLAVAETDSDGRFTASLPAEGRVAVAIVTQRKAEDGRPFAWFQWVGAQDQRLSFSGRSRLGGHSGLSVAEPPGPAFILPPGIQPNN